jgi:shikimate kinase
MENQTSCLFLIGMPGSGKSTIGKGLAKTLARPFVDLDQQIEERCGVAISIIFEIEGEQGFRKRETQVLTDAANQRGMVVATGGGAILAPENQAILREQGVVVYLRATVDELLRRTSRDKGRPLLATNDPRAKLLELFERRGPIYESLADVVVESGSSSVTSVVQKIVSKLKKIEGSK